MRAESIALVLVAALAASACGNADAPQPTSVAAPHTSVAAPTVAAAPESPAPEPPAAPTPFEIAEAAAEAHNFAAVCAYLVTRGFAADICDWIAGTAAGGRDRLNSRRLETFLRAQHVRRVSGSIVDSIGTNEYETRIGGQLAILTTTETSFETTGRFSMWAQQNGSSQEELASGRMVEVPIYREWPLFDAIASIARTHSPEEASSVAQSVLEEALRGWGGDYCYTAPEADDCWVDSVAVVAPVAATAETEPVVTDAGAPAVSDARRSECRRICGGYLECRSLGFSFGDCRDDMSSACRACRDEGAVR